MTGLAKTAQVAVIGAGTMGAGIAQVAAAAGHPVLLFDAAPGAAEKGRQRLAATLEGAVAKGRLSAIDAGEQIGRITVAASLAELAGASLVIEAIIEDLAIKRGLFAELEALLGQDAILATNTSSISVTAIAGGLKRPGHVVGMHFFNPAPVMKLVEVVSGLATDPGVAGLVHATATAWGKIAVHTRSTPGFIVNRVARGYYGEALRLLEEGVATPPLIDALMTQGGGFRMGPFALMDLIGNDVNFAVSKSVFDAYHQEPRFRPSLIQQEMVSAGRLGRKSGIGFYDYRDGAGTAAPVDDPVPANAEVWPPLDLTRPETRAGVLILPSDGQTAQALAAQSGQPVIVCDLCEAHDGPRRLGFACSPDVGLAERQAFIATLAAQSITATLLPDWPGLVVLRTLAIIANEGFEAVMQGVADEAGVDAAMKYGVNYPQGPLGWARRIGLSRILATLDNLQHLTGDMRYRPSFGLRRAAI